MHAAVTAADISRQALLAAGMLCNKGSPISQHCYDSNLLWVVEAISPALISPPL